MSDFIPYDEFKSKVATSEDTLTAMYNLLKAVNSPIVAASATAPAVTAPVTEAPAANDPAVTAPAAEAPAAATPEVKYRTVAGTINDYDNEHWNNGAWKYDQRAGVSIRATEENRAAFKVGATVQFKNGEFRKITEVHDNDGTNLSIWMDGAQISAEQGAPYAISTKVVDADVPAPVLDATADNVPQTVAPVSGKFRTGFTLGFDMQTMGINIAGAEFGGTFPGDMGRTYVYPGRDSFQKWKNEGCEFVRYPVKWERLQRNLYGDLYGPDMAELDKAYQAAADLGMWIMLDIHNYMRRYINGSAYLIGSQQVPTAAYVDFIIRMAKWLKGKKAHFGLDIMNEPYPLQPTWPAIAEAACKGYRSVDAESFIILEGTMWANAHGWESKNPGFPLKGIEGIIYQAHCYCDSNAGGLFGNRGEQVNPAAGTNRQNDFISWGKKHNVPLLVGEYSAPYNMPTAIVAMENQIKQLNDNGILHTFWAAGPWWTQAAANGVETGGQMREPISVLRKYWKANKRIRTLGPNA